VSSSPTDAETVEVTMPQMGVSVAEGTVVIWHKQPGDWVQADETICEITTDKIDCDVPAPVSGRVEELLVQPEQTVPVGTPLARISTDAVAGEAHPAEHLGDSTAAPAEHLEDSAASPAARPEPAVSPGAAARPAGPSRHYSPVVQRIARREGIDLADVPGSGRGGRVRKQDVLAFVQSRADGNGNGESQPPLHIESPYREDEPGAGEAQPQAAEEQPQAGERLSRMRRSIATHMVESLRTAAHCTSITEADMSQIEAARERLGLTYLPFIARCAVDALRAHPQLNATLEGEILTLHREVHLGVAVSLGPEGLIVPVIHDAQDLSHEGLSKRIAELARRARAGELSADDVRGGTFTITNPGGYGTIASTPIINQPQVAILDLEAVVRRPVVVKDEQGGEAVAIRPMTNLCLSWDHRALDGALAAQFLGAMRERIEHWESA
jgi:pyruvate/2-oxoglutarate dehydrogenase complex dihydrolipoamide acyltransferase (E2) component